MPAWPTVHLGSGCADAVMRWYFYADIGAWDTSKVTRMIHVLEREEIESDIGAWNTSKVSYVLLVRPIGRLLVGSLGDRADSTSVFGTAYSARVIKALAADECHGSHLHW